MAEETAAGYLDGRIDALREHVISLVAAVPALPAQFARVSDQLAQDWQARPPGYVAGLILGFLLLGFAVEAAYRRWVAVPAIADGRSGERACSIGLRFARDLGALAAFTVGSAALFLAFEWPPRTRAAVVAFLAAFVALRAVIVASRALLSPRDARLRVVPANDAEARFWHLRIALFSGWLAFGWVVVNWLALLGMDLASRQIVAYALGLGLLAIAIDAFWRRTRLSAPYFVLLWLLWAAQAWGIFWLAVVAGTLPPALRLVQAAANNTFSGIPAAVVGRGLRAALIIGAAFLLVRAFGLDVDALAAGDTFWTRLLRGAVHAVAIVLVADVLWMICAALIDRQLASVQSSTGEGNRAARLRTLLPIVRSTIAAALIVMVVLTALSALGIEVGPLLAGAGVVGVAIGFGAQTLVRDLFSKFFYLLDDAFRVGEYIESGNYKGTVEHLGARSVRLRHHRGPVFTIPYGQLGAVKNSSRDWVIDKMMIGVVYGSDLEKVKKIIKDIGKKLATDPEFGPKILEPLKMQGVEQFSDFAIQIRMKMKTQPNEQFGIRRRAYAMINEAFAANGIKFAHPTVQVAGPADAASAAAARQALELKKVS